MKLINHILLIFSLLGLPLWLSSCTDEEDDLIIVDRDEVAFAAVLPEVSSRSTYEVIDSIDKAGFTVSAFWTERTPEANGFLPVHCEDVVVTRQADGAFRSDGCKWPLNRADSIGHLKFFAFHPSRKEMKKRAEVGNECFIYSNSSTKDADGITYDYRLRKFRVAPDISKQVDFVIATGEGNKTTDLYSVVELDFEHQLCGVEIGVWGASTLYDVEIAGVRIGGTIVEADFNLSTVVEKPAKDENTIGSWIINDSSQYGHVDYVFSPGDKVVCINAKEHNTKEKATSIMGGGGKAMVIPYKHNKWNYKTDRTNNAKGMYFSALIRMTQREGDHHRIFPSTDPASQDYIVYLSVNKSDGMVKKRLDKYGNIYGTTTKYNKPATEEIRHYGWAAVPVNVDWKASYTYSYILDYSAGVGVHDPADSNPASTIVDWDGVEVTTYTGLWGGGETIKYGGWGANSNNTGPDGTVWWK